MSVTFNAKVIGNVPAHRCMVLAGRDDENNILVEIADGTQAVDFVSTRDLSDGETITVTLQGDYQIWEIETVSDVVSGQWVSCREDGKVGNRGVYTVEDVGFTLEPAKEGEIVKVVRRESYNNSLAIYVSEKLTELESRLNALENGN